jgi:signal transduction histidine kinase
VQRLQARLIRAVLRRLDPTRGEVQVLSDSGHIRELLRLAALFFGTVFLPGVALAWIGFAGIRGDELAIQNAVEQQGEREVRDVMSDIDALFADFENSVRMRLESGRSPVDAPRTLSPYALVGFRMNDAGQLEAPFRLGDDRKIQDHAPYFSGSWVAAAAEDEPQRAEQTWARIASRGTDPHTVGQALYNRALALERAGRQPDAVQLLAELYSDYHDVRNLHGFRLGDLARLRRGQLLLAREPEIGQGALETLVDDLLQAEWSIGYGNESAVAARALELLEDHSERDWLASRRGRLEERSRQLFWAEQLYTELTTLNPEGRALPVSRGEITYKLDDQVLWATLWWGEERADFYAFALDRDALVGALNDMARSSTRVSGELNMLLVNANREPPADTLVRRSLNPWLPGWSLVVHPRSAADLEAARARKRLQRVSILVLSLVMISTGAVMSTRLVVQQLEVARSKADFAANVSHELRSPITQIRLKGESLQFGLVEDPKDLQAHYDAIVRESERLSRLVDNVLDFAAIERGAKRYTIRPVPLGDTVRSTVEAARYAMETRDMVFDVDVPLLPVVMHDPEAVAQVLHNLISNAAKYGAEGGWIGVKARIVDEDVVISVSDRGIGIDPAEIPLLFEHFYRSKDPVARRKKGTGIGLTIVQYIMEAHGGHVVVSSAPGAGATFTLHFPTKPPEPPN